MQSMSDKCSVGHHIIGHVTCHAPNSQLLVHGLVWLSATQSQQQKTQDTPEKLTSTEAKAVLESLAATTCTDIAAIEARHATNREASLMRAKGWLTSLAIMSSKFILHCSKKMSSMFKASSQSQSHEKKRSKKKKVVRGGGAWRAFCHVVGRGIRFTAESMQEMAEQYRRLTPEEKEQYVLAGEAATRSHRMGFKSFGPSSHTGATSGSADQGLKPGDLTSDGAIVAGDFNFFFEQQLLTYTGPDLFSESFDDLTTALQKQKVQVDSDGLTLQQQNEVQAFQESDLSSDSSNNIVANWHRCLYIKVTSSLARIGSRMKTLDIFQYVPPVMDLAKATKHHIISVTFVIGFSIRAFRPSRKSAAMCSFTLLLFRL